MVTWGNDTIIDKLQSVGIDVPIRFYLDGWGGLFWGTILIFLISRSQLLKTFFKMPIMKKGGNLSFYVYILHMPIIMSISTWICIHLFGLFEYNYNVLCNYFCSLLVVLLLSFVYSKTVGKYDKKVTGILDNLFTNFKLI